MQLIVLVYMQTHNRAVDHNWFINASQWPCFMFSVFYVEVLFGGVMFYIYTVNSPPSLWSHNFVRWIVWRWLLKLVDDVSHFPSSEAYFPAVYVGVTPTEGMEVEIIHPLKYKLI